MEEEYALLKAESDVCYQRGVGYLTKPDGWELTETVRGITTSVHIDGNIGVIRFEGIFNKPPPAVLRFFSGNLADIRKKYYSADAGTEYVQSFPDRSHVIKEINNHPVWGYMELYRYYCHTINEDGSFDLNASSPNLEKYPKGKFQVYFFILRVVHHEGGSKFTLVSSVNFGMVPSIEQVSHSVHHYRDFYANITDGINSSE